MSTKSTPSGTERSGRGEELVSVIIPALDEEQTISICLDSVLSQTWQNLEVIIADGGSTDRTRELIDEYQRIDRRVRWVHNERRSQPAALNTAMEYVQSKWFVRIDAHSTIPPNYVENIMKHLGTGKWGGVGGRKDGVATSEQGKAIVAALGSKFGVGNSTYHHGIETQVIDHIPFGAYPVAVIRELGGWDEDLVSQEDFEFDYRVRLSGRELLFDPAAVISWETRETVTSFFQQYRRYGRAKTHVLAKHPESASPRHVLPGGLVAALVLAVALLPFRPKWAALVAGPYLGAITVATVTVAPSVAEPASRRWLPFAFMSMHLGYGLGLWESLITRFTPSPVTGNR